MPRDNRLPDYLDSLPAGHRDRFAELNATVSTIVSESVAGSASEAVRSFTFLPNQVGHPDWDDADVVFWRAVEELYLASPRRDQEIPLFYWGFHSLDILARRSSNGVLVTDQAVYVRDVPRATVSVPLASLDPHNVRIEGSVLRVGEATIDLTPALRLMTDATPSASSALLSAVITGVRAAAPAASTDATAASASVADLVQASAMSGDFLLPGRDADTKKLAKLTAKWKLPATETIRVAWTSSTLMGFYGLAITDTAAYSKDLGDELVRTPREQLDGSVTWLPESKEFALSTEQRVPTLPSITDENREYFVGLLGSLLAART